MDKCRKRQSFTLVTLCMVIIAAVPLTCDGSSAYYSQGTTYNPYAGWTESVTSSGTVYVYYGTEVDITFVVEDDFDEVTVTTTSANCGLSIDGLRVHGTMTSYSAVFEVSGLMDGYEYPVYSLTIRAKNLIPVDGANVGSYYECDLSGGEYSGYSVTGGHLPSGLALYSDGVVKGTPSEAGTFYFTTSFMNRGVQVIYDRSITVTDFGSTTSTSVDTKYVVEGTSFSFTVHGTAASGAEYRANVTATGGSVTPATVGDGDTVTFTAPIVSGKTSFTVTVTSDIEGCGQSQAKITVWVVDALAVSAPAIGTISSS